MLEFNKNHRVVDLSEIKDKIEKAKKSGTIKLCSITLSALMLMSGCTVSNNNSDNNSNEYKDTDENITATAIITDNGNAMIVDIDSYDKYVHSIGGGTWAAVGEERTWVLVTTSGDKLLVDYESLKIIEGENSHEKAEMIAENFLDEDGKIIYYDETQNYEKNK